MSDIETSDLETHLLECYLFVDDYLQSNPKVARWRRSNNIDSDCTDVEVIVIALMQGYFRTDTLKRTCELVVANAGSLFPDRAGYKQWIRRLQQLPDQVGRLLCVGSPGRSAGCTWPTRSRFPFETRRGTGASSFWTPTVQNSV